MIKQRLFKATVMLGLFALSAEALAVGPVTHSPARDQKDSGFCWSYSTAGLIEGEALKKGTEVHLSPEYLGFYHVFTQLQTHLGTYQKLALANIGALHNVAVGIVKDILQPQSGNIMKVALQELAQYGTVPESVFHFKLISGDDGLTFDQRLTTFAENQLLNSAKLSQYIANPDNLLNDLYEVFGAQVPKSSDSFQYDGKSYTPQSFLSSYLGFDPNNYEEITVRKYNHDSAMQTIEKALQDNVQVPIGFEVMNDQENAQQTGTFDPSQCPGGKCTSNGGHEVLIVGSQDSDSGAVSGLIIKNSWGDIGLDDVGDSSDDSSKLGFFIIKNEYLELDEGLSGWSFVVPKSYVTPSATPTVVDRWNRFKKHVEGN